jgi:hypothetical protein
MTGGYGSSYAASVGNQAYQASLQQLNDVIPQLYQMAYDRYNQEGQDLYNQYGMLSNEKSTEYGMWTDEGNRLSNDRTYASDQYNTAYTNDYGQWMDKTNILDSNRTYHTGNYYNEYNMDYGQHRDAVGDSQWQASHDLATSQFDWQKEQANKPTTVSNPTLTAAEYNDVLTNAGDYASKGETALANYLNGLVARGLSEDEAAAIYEQYFPTKLPTKTPTVQRYGGSGGRIEYTMN